MSFDIIMPKAKAIEAQLRKRGFRGKGIHELVTSAGDALPRDVCRAARKVASIRNKVVHDDKYTPTNADLKAFLDSAAFVTAELTQTGKRTPISASGRRNKTKVSAKPIQLHRARLGWRVWVKVAAIFGGAAVLIGLLILGVSDR
jgi:hypothetical protein